MVKQIMVVDDDESVLTLTGVILKRHGFAVLKAHNAKIALDTLDSVSPDLFILDIMMPEIDGIEMCRLLRNRPETHDTPIIMFSAYSEPQLFERCQDAGANLCLPKLTSHQELAAQVKLLLGLPHAENYH